MEIMVMVSNDISWSRLCRRATLTAVLGCLLVWSLTPAVAAADWNEPFAGPLNVDVSQHALQSDITNVGGVPYVAWSEYGGSTYQLRVKRFTGGTWEQVGGSLNVDPTKEAAWASITAVGGVPYVAWGEKFGSSSYQIHVKQFTAGAWAPVGGVLNVDPTKNASSPSIADIGGVPYVAWRESDGSFKQIRVAKFTGAWSPVGSSLNMDPLREAFPASITDIGGVPYVAWSENIGGSTYQVRVKQFTGGAWSTVGGSLNIDPTKSGFYPDIIDIGGVPYVAWYEDNGSYLQVHVKQFTGGVWTAVGGVLNVDPARDALNPSITDIGGVPYVAWYEDNGSWYQIRVKQFTGGVWSAVGGSLNVDSTGNGLGPDIADIGGVPYVAWDEYESIVLRVRVKRFTTSPTADPTPPAADPTSPATDPTSPTTDPTSPVLPNSTSLLKISGKTKVGKKLTTTTGTWTGTGPMTYTYKWLRCDKKKSAAKCKTIAKATKLSYKVTRKDIGHRLRFNVVASNSVGAAAATAKPTAVVKK